MEYSGKKDEKRGFRESCPVLVCGLGIFNLVENKMGYRPSHENVPAGERSMRLL